MTSFIAAVLASKTALRLTGRLAVLRAFVSVLGIAASLLAISNSRAVRTASSRLIGCARTTIRRVSRSACSSVNLIP